jgi:hypothetical protein
MAKWINKLSDKKYPQNFIIKSPFIGTLFVMIFSLGFVILYRPLDVQEARSFSFVLTMFFYCILLSVSVFGSTWILKRTNCFSDNKGWTISKELFSVVIIILGIGITSYFAGFLIEEPSSRWNMHTFWDSFKRACLVGMIPPMFFTLSNFRYLFVEDILQEFKPDTNPAMPEQKERLIQIISQLKKEELSFFPAQFVYSESDGNYVVFHLDVNEQHKEILIRNSISNIEQQLSSIPYFLRTHRAFIVNVKKVSYKKGNTLGYRLKLIGTDAEVPVSRQNTRKFDQLIRQYK